MTTELMQRARAGLKAWQRGGVEALAALLDPEVELTWWEPGDWDCHGRGAVLSNRRERVASGPSDARIGLLETGDPQIVATRAEIVGDGPAPGLRPATLLSFRDASVVGMRQFRGPPNAALSVDAGLSPALSNSRFRYP